MTPHFGWNKEEGTYRIDSSTEPIETPKPSGPNAEGGTETFHVCTVDDCGRDFRLAAIMARHFNTTHGELADTDDAWREYRKKVEK